MRIGRQMSNPLLGAPQNETKRARSYGRGRVFIDNTWRGVDAGNEVLWVGDPPSRNPKLSTPKREMGGLFHPPPYNKTS